MRILFLASLLCGALSVWAQPGNSSVYLELGGPGAASLNYDLRFAPQKNGLGARVGLGGFWLLNTDQRIKGLTVPVELNYFVPWRNFFVELGAGLGYRKVSYHSKTTPIDSASSTIDPYLDLALRYASPRSRFLCRAAFTPFLKRRPDIQAGGFSFGSDAWFGISAGLRLGSRKAVR